MWQAVKRTSTKERVLGILGHWGAASRPLCTDEHQGSPSAQLSVANVYCAMWFWKEPSTYPPPQPSQPLTRRPKRKPMGHPAFTCLLLPCLSLACLDPPTPTPATPPPCTGDVRYLAGDCSTTGAGNVQGEFTAARFNNPTCIITSVAKPNMAFLCDTGNNAVRVINMLTREWRGKRPCRNFCCLCCCRDSYCRL